MVLSPNELLSSTGAPAFLAGKSPSLNSKKTLETAQNFRFGHPSRPQTGHSPSTQEKTIHSPAPHQLALLLCWVSGAMGGRHPTPPHATTLKPRFHATTSASYAHGCRVVLAHASLPRTTPRNPGTTRGFGVVRSPRATHATTTTHAKGRDRFRDPSPAISRVYACHPTALPRWATALPTVYTHRATRLGATPRRPCTRPPDRSPRNPRS